MTDYGDGFYRNGDASAPDQQDTVFEYERDSLYLKATTRNGAIRCINLLGGAGISGIVKDYFIKYLGGQGASLQPGIYLYQGSDEPGIYLPEGSDSYPTAQGRKAGEGKFEPVTWEKAYQEIAKTLSSLIESHIFR